MSELAEKTCVPCRGGVPPLSKDKIDALLEQVPGWSAQREHHISRTFDFPDFVQALAFVNRAGAVAEEQAHHPDMHLAWGKVRVEVWTHKIDGLTESDFILAARINQLL